MKACASTDSAVSLMTGYKEGFQKIIRDDRCDPGRQFRRNEQRVPRKAAG